MPRYTLTDSDTGRSMVVEGDAPPTPEDAAELFAGLPEKPKEPGLLERFDDFMRKPRAMGSHVPKEEQRPMTGPEDPQGPSSLLTPERQKAATQKLTDTTLRVGVPVAATALAPVSGGATLPLALGAAGAFTGEIMAQEREMERGEREKMGTGALVAAPVAAAIPLGPAAKGAMFADGALVAARPLAALQRGAAGGVVAGGASAIEQGVDNGEIDWGAVMKSSAFGVLFGSTLGASETLAATRAGKEALLELRKRTGDWRSTDLEFMDMLRARARGRAPGVPADEGAAVSPEAVQAIPDNYGASAPAHLEPGPSAPIVPRAPVVDTAETAREAAVRMLAQQRTAFGSEPLTPEMLAAAAMAEQRKHALAVAPQAEPTLPTAAEPTGIPPVATEEPAPVVSQEATPPAAVDNVPAGPLEPWRMTPEEWERANDAQRPETFGSSSRGGEALALSRHRERQRLAYGVTDAARARLEAAGRGEVVLGPVEVEELHDRINMPVTHRAVIAKALHEGKPVPPEILAQYPELTPKLTPVSAVPASEPAPVAQDEAPQPASAAPAAATVEAPPAATVEQTPAGPKVEPTAARDAQVGKMADRKQLRVQKEYLVDALQKAEAAAPDVLDVTPAGTALREEVGKIEDTYNNGDSLVKDKAKEALHALLDRLDAPREVYRYPFKAAVDAVKYWAQRDHAEHITIEVPGDGTFRVPYAKENLRNFARTVESRFGKTTANLPSPFSNPAEANKAPAPTGLASLKKKPTAADLTKAAALAVSADPSRPLLHEPLQDGAFTIATNGAQMTLAVGGKGKAAAELVRAAKAERIYNWRQVIPGWVQTEGGRITTGREPHAASVWDTTEALKMLNQVQAVIGGTKSNGVSLFVLPDGRLGVRASSPDVGTYTSEGVAEDDVAHKLMSPDLLHNAIAGARLAGHESVRVWVGADEATPLVMIGGDNFASIIMPQRMGGPAAPLPSKVTGGNMNAAEAKAAKPAKRGKRAEMPEDSERTMGDLFGNAADDLPPQPPRTSAPEDNPDFTDLPIEGPEMYQFWKVISGGKSAAVRRKLDILNALGTFSYREGSLQSGRIDLKADLWKLVTEADKQELLRRAVAYAQQLKQADASVNTNDATRARYKELLEEFTKQSMEKGARRALAVFAHEIGHFLDFYPHGTIRRGNILGRLASLKSWSKEWLAQHPAFPAKGMTAAERDALRTRAEKELRAGMKTIVETIRRETPVYRDIPVTAEDIVKMFNTVAGTDSPQLYDWFARLGRKDKIDIVKKAMQGIVDERAKRFNRREQTGTQVTEETVERTVGTPPTGENIRARFEELLRAEMQNRGLLNLAEIRAELSRAIAWWRGVKEIPDYYKTPEEMWADTMSIFLNNPRGLAKQAPKFYAAWMEWMSAKPGMMKAYHELQRDMRSGQIFKDRVTRFRDMLARDEAAGKELDRAQSKLDMQHVRDMARILLDAQFGPMERRVAQQAKRDAAAGVPPGRRTGERTLDAIENFLYRATAWEAYMLDLRHAVEVPLAGANLTHADMGEFLTMKRITEGSRRDLANTLFTDTRAALQRLEEMKAQFGDERFAALEQAQRDLRSVYEKHVITALKEAGVMSPALAQAVESETFYAPFNKARVALGEDTDSISALIKLHHGDRAAGKIFSQVGYLGEIRNPYVQMTQRAMGLLSMAARQRATKAVVSWLQQHEPDSIAPADTVFNGRRLEVKEVENSRVSTLYTLDAGTVHGWYVPRAIGEMFSHGNEAENLIVGLAHKVFGPIKAVITELNPGFWPVAHGKDVLTAAWQLPRGARFLSQLPGSYRAARRTFTGPRDALAQAALDRRMVISRADSRGEHLGHSDEMTRILLRMGKDPALWDAETTKIERALRKAWQFWTRQGQILERATKIASMRHLDAQFPHMPEGEKRRVVHDLGGSPNFLRRGRWAKPIDALWMFYNPWKESLRAMKRAHGRDPRGWWTKFLGGIGLGAAALWAVESGYFNGGMSPEDAEDYRDQLRSIPERDKLRGFPIVLGWEDKEKKKVAYLLLPFPDNARSVHALFRKSLQTASGDNVGNVGADSILSYQGQDTPGMNPFLEEGRKWWEYHVQKRNPYDSHTGMGTLDDDAVTAGTAGGDLALQTASQLTGGILYRYRPERRDDDPTSLEELLNAPVVGNILGRWLRVSNRGQMEQHNRDKAEVVKEEALMRTIGDDMLKRMLRNQPWSAEQSSLVSESPYLAQYIIGAFPKVAMGAESPYMKALMQARTNAQKLAIITAENKRNEERLRRIGVTHEAIPLPP